MPYYNRAAAASYAQRYALTYNKAWLPDEHSDCTNFVSQALYAGGWEMIVGFPGDPYAWFATRKEQWHIFSGRTPLERSSSWAGAEPFTKFVLHSGRAILCKQEALMIGDFVQLLNEQDEGSHTMIVTEGKGENCKLSYHTVDRLNQPLSAIIKRNANVRYFKAIDYIVPAKDRLHYVQFRH